jgi:hypothetical protein
MNHVIDSFRPATAIEQEAISRALERLAAAQAAAAVVEVEVALMRGQWVNYFVVAQCPWCGRSHVHGAGRLDQDPRAFVGTRVSHCAAGKTYRLRWGGTEVGEGDDEEGA